MSHQTGIKASSELQEFLANSKSGNIRLMKITIVNEQLTLNNSLETSGTWQDDYERFVPNFLEDKMPCYLMFRLDSTNQQGFEWIFISYSPDNSPVRQKMLYAGTRATMKKEFGGGHIAEDLFGTTPDDVSYVGYLKHMAAKAAPPPRTFAEEEIELIKQTEVHADIGVDTKHQTMQGVAFPISESAFQALVELKNEQCHYVQLSLDLKKEIINLEQKSSIGVNLLIEQVPQDHARYHIIRYNHSHESDYISSILFIYTMPENQCSVRERMLYSSCKSPLISILEQKVSLEIDKKIEVGDANELTETFLYEEVHPNKNVAKQKFARPKAPGGRGPKRLTKSNN